MKNEQLISDLIDMFFEAKKIVDYLPTNHQEHLEKVIFKFYKSLKSYRMFN